MKLPECMLENLETPCVVIDEVLAKENIRRVQAECDKAGVALRPHIKTHKMPYFARLQVEAGAKGITSCKVSEAEVMADGGLDDIFLAYPLVGRPKLERAMLLSKRVKRLILAVDSVEQAQALNEAAGRAGIVQEVRMEVDTGAKRTGVTKEKRLALAKALKDMKNLKLTGIYTFKSLILDEKPTEDNEAAGEEEGRLLEEIRRELLELGFENLEVSGGSTPTGLQVARTGKVDEIRPGTYIFNDYMLTKEKADGDSFSFTIPSDVVGTYASSIRIAFDLEIRDLYCTKRTDEMPWAYVSGDSTLYLPAGQSTDYSLALRPYPFQTLGLFNDLALVLPDKYTGEELELAGSVMSLMGSAISPYGSFQAVKASDYDPSAGTADSADDKSGNNIIAIGTYQDNSLIQSLNKNLSFRFLDDGSGFDSNDQLLVSPDYGKRVGILQIIRSPYADKRAVLTVSAADTTGLESIQNYIRLQKNNWSMEGDAFLIDTDGDTSSYTFLKHEETDQVSLKEKVKQNKNAILFTLVGSMAMFILFIGVIITLVHYRRNRRDEDRK